MRKLYQYYPAMRDIRRFQAGGWPWRAVNKLLYVSSERERKRLIRGWENGDYKDTSDFFRALQLNGKSRTQSQLRRAITNAVKRCSTSSDRAIALARLMSAKTAANVAFRNNSEAAIASIERQLARLRKCIGRPRRAQRRRSSAA